LNLSGATPFLLAAQAVDVPLMRLLVAHGADPLLATLDGTTPLMAAAGIGYDEGRQTAWSEAASLEAVTLAASLGGRVNAVDQSGNTALHGAALTGANSVVRFLVEQGALLDATNKQGWTPLTIADGIHLGALFKVRPQTAVLLRQLAAK
jgi:ankyrin repeat protein